MPKFILKFESSSRYYDYEVGEYDDQEKATMAAYELWRQAAEDNADYEAVPYTKEACEDADLDFEE